MSNCIALAIDFKKFTPSILETGLFLKKNIYTESEVILFHVVEYFLTPPHYLIPYFEKEKEKIEKELLNIYQKFKNEGILVKTEVILGNFWEGLKNFIKNLKPHLVVIGYQPYRVKISTAEKMLERLECNFLVVKEDKPLERIKKILCCIDFSKKSINCLKMAIFWSKKLKADLKILNVIPEIKIKNKKMRDEVVKKEKSEREKLWQNLLSSLEENEKIDSLNFEITYGDKLKEILKNAESSFSDLLIVGKTGKNLKSGLGSITKELLKKTQTPLLIVENF